ncbi:hypothetical protein [Paenibacillus cisolokensis]|uniref:hypothetical protein n=1 Tax=Paenibacillus cisolokensis TaxID=1658519 RepID=UPI001BCD129A|nr:hypothetical protein [Paenibacillus cisolokensis]
MNLQAKVLILRQYETYCYQVSSFIVQDEQLSIQAAQSALLKLATDSSFFVKPEHEQKRIIQKVTIRSALEVYTQKIKTC